MKQQTKQDYSAKARLWFTNKQDYENYGYGGKTLLGKTWHETWIVNEVRILQGVLETKYCGEVIGDGVQLWTETGDLSETKWQGKKHDLET